MGRNKFISKEEINRLRLKPVHYESPQIVTVNGTKKQSLPVFSKTIDSVDDKVSEKIQITIIKTPTLIKLKEKYEHLRGKIFNRTSSEEHPMQFTSLLGDDTYYEIQTEKVYKVRPEEPIVEGATLVCSWWKGLCRQQVTRRNCTSVMFQE